MIGFLALSACDSSHEAIRSQSAKLLSDVKQVDKEAASVIDSSMQLDVYGDADSAGNVANIRWIFKVPKTAPTTSYPKSTLTDGSYSKGTLTHPAIDILKGRISTHQIGDGITIGYYLSVRGSYQYKFLDIQTTTSRFFMVDMMPLNGR